MFGKCRANHAAHLGLDIAVRDGDRTTVAFAVHGERRAEMPQRNAARGIGEVLGVLEAPALAERWVGCEGRPTLFNGRQVRTSDCRATEQAVVYTTTPETFDAGERRRFEALSARAALRRFGGDCYLYGMLAGGHCDLVIEVQLKPHDFMAAIPVVEGAGGRISDWRGAPLSTASDGRVVAAATEPLWRQAIRELSA